MLVFIFLIMLSGLSLFNLILEKGSHFYKDNRFWITIGCMGGIVFITSMMII